MHARHRETKQKLTNKVAVANDVEAVLADTREFQIASDRFAIENNRRAGESARSERKDVGSSKTIAQSFAIARESFHVTEQIMREQNWLRALQVRVARHHNIGMFAGEVNKSTLEISREPFNFRDLIFHVQPKIERDLIITASRSVQFCAGL